MGSTKQAEEETFGPTWQWHFQRAVQRLLGLWPGNVKSDSFDMRLRTSVQSLSSRPILTLVLALLAGTPSSHRVAGGQEGQCAARLLHVRALLPKRSQQFKVSTISYQKRWEATHLRGLGRHQDGIGVSQSYHRHQKVPQSMQTKGS